MAFFTLIQFEQWNESNVEDWLKGLCSHRVYRNVFVSCVISKDVFFFPVPDLSVIADADSFMWPAQIIDIFLVLAVTVTVGNKISQQNEN